MCRIQKTDMTSEYGTNRVNCRPEDEDELILLFVKTKNGVVLDDALRKRICTKIR